MSENSDDLSEDSKESAKTYLPKNQMIPKMKPKINSLINKKDNKLKLSISERKQCFDTKTNSYKCPESDCNKYYKTFQSFALHIAAYHSNRELFYCDFSGCGKKF